MYSVTHVVGRLLVTTLVSPVFEEDMGKIREILAQALVRRKERVLIFGDYTRAKLVDPNVRQLFTGFLNAANPDVARSAILVSVESTLIFEQFAAIVRESRHPSRRLFKDAYSLEAWLGEVMTDEERAGLKSVFAERGIAPF